MKKYGLVTLYMEVMVCLMKLFGKKFISSRRTLFRIKNKTISITKWYVFEEEIKKFDEKMPFNVVKENYALF